MERPKNPPRGTYDLLPEQSLFWGEIETIIKDIVQKAAFKEIRTPIFEATEIFERSAGESSDIVNKEMYTFTDRSDRSITLRPEGTAGVVRAFLSNGLDRSIKPLNLWYLGPMFRYERSQTGRYRQFIQFGVESFGIATPEIEFESINLAWTILKELEKKFGLIEDVKGFNLEINSVGDADSRNKYQEVLREFLQANESSICEDCKRRITTNPLRALDCKVPQDQKLYSESAPKIQDYLTESSKAHQKRLLELLSHFDIPYSLNQSLVRGLDYYTKTVFEIKVISEHLGQQSTICAGGRYDNLVKEMGGPETPAFGWALGMERLTSLFKNSQTIQDGVYVVGDKSFEENYQIVLDQRKEGNLATLNFDGKNKNKQIEHAKRLGLKVHEY
jgi:histidyl-tRNA synthetase